MKRLATLLAVMLVSITLLASCDGGKAPIEQDTNTYVTLADFLTGDEFDALNGGIEDGSDLPSELFYSEDNGWQESIYDQDLILGTWNKLCAVEINADDPQDIDIDDGGIRFNFVWEDGRRFVFAFSTIEYYASADGTLYPLRTPDIVRILSDETDEYLQRKDRGIEGELIEFKATGNSGLFDWDADGDGEAELFSADFWDNGDEAPSNYEITCESRGYGTAWIDGGYSIVELNAASDDQGPYLYITYYAGDYYNHDTLSACTLRLVDGQLTVEQLALDE